MASPLCACCDDLRHDGVTCEYNRGYRAGQEAALAVAHEHECAVDDDHLGVCLILREHFEQKGDGQ